MSDRYGTTLAILVTAALVGGGYFAHRSDAPWAVKLRRMHGMRPATPDSMALPCPPTDSTRVREPAPVVRQVSLGPVKVRVVSRDSGATACRPVTETQRE
jgi:hypothetical protein